MSIKKILLVGNFNNNPKIYTYASSFLKAFQKLDYTVEQFNYKDSKFNIPLIGKHLLNYSLLKSVEKFKPDLIFVLKADNISHKTLRRIKKNKNIILINFYPDNPFVFWNGNSNANVLMSLPIYDLFLIWSHQLIPILYSAGAKRVEFFPFVFEPEMFEQDLKISPKDVQRFESDVCFIGSWDTQREEWLSQLIHKIPTLKLAIWGNRWHENLPQNSILKPYLKGCAIYGIDMIKAFRLSKIVLNFIRKQNLDAHNMRTIEVPACKAFLLTQKTKDQAEMLFKQGTHIECFENIDELTQKIDLYLSHPEKRLKIVQAGYEKAQEYSIEKTLWTILKNL